ncbi:PKD domain-containing protein [Alcanivorax quisquiliarum]|uniref:PKD domain-containing protein n=1 Tax=Alcanivorax quisquiliarum TaxID=2933565 RepID=A0ABT0EA11_9GAMM|nr:PKD domain-containing protein [Alcanivorax quisquiliarum]MCK0538661.1 PKD domain-containing protein [Alcanivorax quisquiliarum]
MKADNFIACKAALLLLFSTLLIACGGSSSSNRGGGQTENTAPIADAGAAQQVVAGATVMLDGSGSFDADGDALAYHWRFIAMPDASSTTLRHGSTAQPSFTADAVGDYVIELIVSDGRADSAPATVTITAALPNSPPVADAGLDQFVKPGDAVTLDGSGSFDADGDTLSYQWRVVQAPTSSLPVLEKADSARPTFTTAADAVGDYVIELIVSDGQASSEPARVTVNVERANSPPVADAGSDQFVKVGDTVSLDGSHSRDADGDRLSYQWLLLEAPQGSAATLTDAVAVRPSFTADAEGVYTLQLIVSDGVLESAPVTVVVTAEAVNTRPTANAGADQNVVEGDTVQLDGSASHDPDGDLLSYRWHFVSLPTGSTATFSQDNFAAPAFVADMAGTYVIELVVSDGELESIGDRVTIEASRANAAPVAHAGPDVVVVTGEMVRLDGSASSDADGDALTFLWHFVSAPNDSAAELIDAATASPYFVADLAGTYVLELVVNDGELDSAPAHVTVTAEAANRRPAADAGPAQQVMVGDTVTLDGRASHDEDDDALAYQWRFVFMPDDSTAILHAADTARPGFTADAAGDYVVELVVNDGEEHSAPATVTITAERPNSAPVAHAGADQFVKAGDTVTLDGSGSFDADGDTLSYHWQLVAAPTSSWPTLNKADTARPAFIADAVGNYVIELIVSDGQADSEPALVTINAERLNSPPVAHAGSDQFVKTGDVVSLDASGSHEADGDRLSYQWSLIELPPGSAATLSDAAVVRPSFTADVEGLYRLRLIVSDGMLDSSPVTVTVTAETANSRPTASAGADQNVVAGDTVQLDGSASRDPDGDLISYHWKFVSRPAESSAVFSSDNAAAPSFIADAEGTYVIELVVSDGELESIGDRVTIEASRANAAPVAHAGADTAVATGDTVLLDGSASSDADGDTLTFLWRFVSAPQGSAAELSDAVTASPYFVADVEGAYVLELVVNDGQLDSAPARVTFTAHVANHQPVAHAGQNQAVTVGDQVYLDGSLSSDPNGDALSYHWTMRSRPEGSSAVLTDAGEVTAALVPDKAGDYVIQLVVNDGELNSDAATVKISAEDPPHLKLEFYQSSFTGPDTWRERSMPYRLNGNSSHSYRCVGNNCPTMFTLDTYRITAVGQDYSLTDVAAVVVGSTGLGLAPQINGLHNGQVIAEGSSVEFTLEVQRINVFQAILQFSFEVVETGARFEVNQTLTLH